MSARKDIVSTSLKIIISSWCLIPHWYIAGERCKRMFVKITCLHETCWLIIISTSCLRNSFNFSPNKAENFHLTDRFRKRLSLSKSLPLHSPFQFQFRTGIRNTYVDQIQVNLIIGHTANCWFSLDVTKNSNYKTIDPTEILLSRCTWAAENKFSYKFSLQKGPWLWDRVRLNF